MPSTDLEELRLAKSEAKLERCMTEAEARVGRRIEVLRDELTAMVAEEVRRLRVELMEWCFLLFAPAGDHPAALVFLPPSSDGLG